MPMDRIAATVPVFALVCLVIGGAAATPLSPVLPDSQTARNPSDIIWCHDEDRDLVTRREAWKCTGHVIDEPEAQKIRARRIRRIQGLIKEPAPLFEGQRLRGTGSGFFVTEDGAVLTNFHVVEKCEGISVTPAGGDALVAELVASDESRDLALLRVPHAPADVASFRYVQMVEPPEAVFVVGYPLHGKVAIKPIFVPGHVIEDRNVPRPGRFPMKIDVRRGNSGGPVLDRAGRVVGVVVAKVNTPHVYAATGRLIRNVGIAIRLPVALEFLRDHGIAFQETRTAPPLSNSEIFSRAHEFVGQIGCWR
jgi:S1-C subfamily serine protease